MNIELIAVSGDQVTGYVPQLAELRIRVFRDFPYLYEGSREYEEKYLSTYTRSDKTIIVLALYHGRVVGASTGIPLTEETGEVIRPFIQAGINPDDVFYFGESVLESEYRGHGTGVRFFEERENHAGNLGYKYTTFCAVRRSDNHPGRPADYISLDKFWHNRGYTRRPDLKTTFKWRDTGETRETEKEMIFWIKEIQ
jgi:GNAT superfamily N-acetyltransferase